MSSVKLKFVSSFSTPHFPSNQTIKLSSRVGLFDTQCCKKNNNLFTNNIKVAKAFELHQSQRGKEILSKRKHILFAISEDSQSTSDLETDEFELEMQQPSAENTTVPYLQFQGSGGKPGLLSFYGHASKRRDDTILVSSSVKDQNNPNNPLWFVGPSVLVASFVFPSLYLRKILSKILEDSLLTDFLILFFTEVLFYCGVAVFLLMIDHLQRRMKSISSAATERELAPHLGHRISNVAVLVLSLIIPMVTMGFVWPWTGPAASATLAPYLVGIVVQFTFEQYARHISSPSWPAIPIIFQVYRLHQLNRAAQLVTALSFTVRGAEMTSHNLAINSSLSTLLNVLQFLGIICIWSLSSFIMRYFPTTGHS